MKIRTDFVTNSSSSSFICDICGREESGFDLSISDCDMMECVNGHIFCCDEALEISSKKKLIRMILENEWNKDVWDREKQCRHDFTEEEISKFDREKLFDDFCSDGGYYGVPECVCPICQFIEYSESDLAAYLWKEYKVSRDEVFIEVKKINKRRRKLYDSEYITYVCKKFDLNPTDIVANWKKRFGTYKNFSDYIDE